MLNNVKAMVLIASISLSGCSSMYYSAMESIGVHKREIMIDRVEDVRNEQLEGEKQFVSAIKVFKELTGFDGGDLEKTYDKLNSEYEDSLAASEAISSDIDRVEDVSDELFDEWESELKQYSRKELRDKSKKQLDLTKKKYRSLVAAMHDAENKMKPVLDVMKDQVLFLKHNLNAKAIDSLRSELVSIDEDIDKLTESMRKSIEEANQFIKQMQGSS